MREHSLSPSLTVTVRLNGQAQSEACVETQPTSEAMLHQASVTKSGCLSSFGRIASFSLRTFSVFFIHHKDSVCACVCVHDVHMWCCCAMVNIWWSEDSVMLCSLPPFRMFWGQTEVVRPAQQALPSWSYPPSWLIFVLETEVFLWKKG